MPLEFSKFLKKVSVEVVVGRWSFQVEAVDKGKFSEEFVERSAVIYLTDDFGKANGFREGDVVRVSSGGKSVNLKVMFSDVAPENGAFMPNSIYVSYLVDFSNFKRFRATIEPADGSVTEIDEIMQEVLSSN